MYLAGPLFTSAERSWNVWLAAKLRQKGFVVVLPQEEPIQTIKEAYIDYGIIFPVCLSQIRSCSAVIGILDRPHPDSGTAFECGHAYALEKPIIRIRTDLRAGGEEGGVNTMLKRSCSQFVAVVSVGSADKLVEGIVQALESASSGDLTMTQQ